MSDARAPTSFNASALARAAGMTPTHRGNLWMATEGDIKRLAEIVAAQLLARQAIEGTFSAAQPTQGDHS